MHSDSNNIKFTSFDDTNKFADELFESLLSKYLDKLEKSMRGRKCIFSPVELVHCKYHRVHFRLDVSFADSPG